MTDDEVADGIVDEIAQKGVSLTDAQWDFAVSIISAAMEARGRDVKDDVLSIIDRWLEGDAMRTMKRGMLEAIRREVSALKPAGDKM